MKYYRIVLTSLLIVFTATSIAGTPQSLSELQQAINTIYKETGVPSIGIALVSDDGPIWVSAIGYADIEQQRPATVDTIYRLGSISKMFTGMAVMRLVEEGRLSLGDRLADIVPDLAFENPWEDTDPVRTVHLLEHTTGWDIHLGEYHGEASDSMKLKDALSRHTASRVSRWVPGTRQAYSNAGPVVAAHVIEKVTGMNFDEYAQRYVFGPLGMESTAFVKSAAFEERGATGYTLKGPTHYRYFHTRPSSSLNASPKDLANVLSMLINRGSFGGQQFLSAATMSRMENAETTLGSGVGIHAGYGLTLDVTGFEDSHVAFYGHTGGIPGGVAEIVYQPERKIGYVFMINQAHPEAFARMSRTLRTYLLRHHVQSKTEPQALPNNFRNLSGFYIPINPSSTAFQAITDISGVMRFETNELYLHRSPFFGGWKSEDYLPQNSNMDALVSVWSGLPSVAFVDDPLAGEVVQVEGLLYKKVSTPLVYGRLFLLVLSIAIAITSVFYLAVWSFTRLFGGRKDKADNNKLQFTLAAPGLLLLAIPLFFRVSNADPSLIIESTPISVFVFVVSLLYPITLAASIYRFYKAKFQPVSKRFYYYSITVFIAHGFIVTYLGCYGLLGFRAWA